MNCIDGKEIRIVLCYFYLWNEKGWWPMHYVRIYLPRLYVVWLVKTQRAQSGTELTGACGKKYKTNW